VVSISLLAFMKQLKKRPAGVAVVQMLSSGVNRIISSVSNARTAVCYSPGTTRELEKATSSSGLRNG
jgi:hypothetical protein